MDVSKRFFYISWAIAIALAYSFSARASADSAPPTIFMVNGSVKPADQAVLALIQNPGNEVYKCQLQRVKVNKKTGAISPKKLDRDND